MRALIFEGSILAYNPTRDKAKWVPACGVINDLSWAEERSVVALVNFVPRIPQEADRLAELGACHLVGWTNDSSSEEADDELTEEEDDKPEGHEHEETGGQEEADPESMLEEGGRGSEVGPRGQCQSREWGAIMDDEEPLTFNDLQSDSDATVGGCSPLRLTPQELGSSQETAMEVHAWDSEVEAL